MSAEKLKLVLCWHMHQPQYAVDGRYAKPWTWLHGIKDYADMAAHLETVPGAKAVVNFSTILLDQLADYAARIERWKANGETIGETIGDSLLDALAGTEPESNDERLALTRACLHANRTHMIDAFPPYAALCRAALRALEAGVPPDPSAFRDLLTWYHLVWTGESVRREHALVRKLQKQGGGFTVEEGRALVGLIGNVLAGLIPRYRRLAEKHVVELSLTPHAHPILPLLIDTRAALEAMPDAPLPSTRYPGGRERCRWHIARALERFEEHFGQRPKGCWPPEGGVSEDVLPLLDEARLAWTATGTNVLRNSLGEGSERAHFRRWQAARDRGGVAIFFRDDELSDRIGFEYSTWDAGHAVEDLIARLDAIRLEWSEPSPPVVSIIMDGENAWEHFPYNAWFFLQHLYSRLVKHPDIELSTFEALLADDEPPAELPRLAAGSWVYGNFAIWIGDTGKNRAWELLTEAKGHVDRALESGKLDDAARADVLGQLAVCEGSDWFWWLGGDNSPENSADFDELFRAQLSALYRLLGETPPDSLEAGMAPQAERDAPGGSMRRASR